MRAPEYSLPTKLLVFLAVAVVTGSIGYDLLVPTSTKSLDPEMEAPNRTSACADRERDGEITSDGLEEILESHQRWLSSRDQEDAAPGGEKAVLCHADLRPHAELLLRYDLTDAVLIGANLEGAILHRERADGRGERRARLNGVNFSEANLRGAVLNRAKLNGAVFMRADLSGAKLRRAQLKGKAEFYLSKLAGADLWRADLETAHFDYADLAGADLTRAEASEANFFTANLASACLYRTVLKDARLKYAKFQDAIFWETELEGARMSRARLAGAVLEPGSLPDVKALSDAEGLQQVTSAARRIGGLAALRAKLAGSGLRTPERQVAFALERERTRLMFEPYPLPQQWSPENPCGIPRIEGTFSSAWAEGVFRLVVFEWLFGYGLYYQRPLEFLWLSVLVFALVYLFYIRRQPNPDAALVIEEGAETIEAAGPPATSPNDSPAGDLAYAKERRLDYVHYDRRLPDACVFAFYFSFISTLHFGVQWLDFGNWIARLQMRSYSIFGVGILRSLSGLQSILGLLFLTLFILSYFGRPLH